jgi:hypothetical protein
MARCHPQHQQTAFAKKKQHDAVFFVITAHGQPLTDSFVRMKALSASDGMIALSPSPARPEVWFSGFQTGLEPKR